MGRTDRKEEILDHAEDLIQRMGSNAMSYHHLSQEIGIRKASIHYYFPHKEDLILALQTRCEQTYFERYQAIEEGPGTAPEKLVAFAKVFADSVRKGKLCVATMLSAEYDNLSAPSRDALKSMTSKTLGIISSILSRGIENREISESVDTNEMAYAYFGFLKGGHLIARCNQSADTFERSALLFVKQLKP
ncbi:MAG: TetR/AcrR family transcriptional regulator [Verrucomicrobiota bacterium]